MTTDSELDFEFLDMVSHILISLEIHTTPLIFGRSAELKVLNPYVLGIA